MHSLKIAAVTDMQVASSDLKAVNAAPDTAGARNSAVTHKRMVGVSVLPTRLN